MSSKREESSNSNVLVNKESRAEVRICMSVWRMSKASFCLSEARRGAKA
jgi:hypothetical protein